MVQGKAREAGAGPQPAGKAGAPGQKKKYRQAPKASKRQARPRFVPIKRCWDSKKTERTSQLLKGNAAPLE
eukprot:1144515-Pelagomonas_calceolata.AAC.1